MLGIPEWTLLDFIEETCDRHAIRVVEKVEEGVVVRLCIALVSNRLFESHPDRRGSVIDVQVPWQAFCDSEEGTLKEIGAYAPFASVSAFAHYVSNEEPVEAKDGWCEVCEKLTSNETLFEIAVTYALAADDSGQLREWMKAHRVKMALIPAGMPQGEEPEPLL